MQRVSSRPSPLNVEATRRIEEIKSAISRLSGVDDFVKISKMRRGIVNLEKLQAQSAPGSQSLTGWLAPALGSAISSLVVLIVGIAICWLHGFGPIAHVPPAWLFPFASVLAWPSPAGSISIQSFLVGWYMLTLPVAAIVSQLLGRQVEAMMAARDLAAHGGADAIRAKIEAAERRRIAGAREKSD